MNKLKDYEQEIINEKSGEKFKHAVKEFKRKAHVDENSSYYTSFMEQLAACVKRQYQLEFGNKGALIFRYVFNIVMAAIVGSVYFQLPFTGAGAFTRGGVLFFALLFNSLSAQVHFF